VAGARGGRTGVAPFKLFNQNALKWFPAPFSAHGRRQRRHHNWPKLIVCLISSLDATAATVSGSTIELGGLEPSNRARNRWPFQISTESSFYGNLRERRNRFGAGNLWVPMRALGS